MANDVNLGPGESVKVNAPTGSSLSIAGSGASVVVTATAAPVPVPPPTSSSGILISLTDLAKLPTAGKAWDAMKARADSSSAWTLASQDSPGSATILAAALIAARTGNATYRQKVQSQLTAGMKTTPDRTLALGRELTSGVLAADLIEWKPTGWDAWLKAELVKDFGGKTLVQTARERPNNWGTHAFAALVASYAQLKDETGLDTVHKWVRGWLGDRSSYAGFIYGDTSWQADPAKPVGINPKGATKQTRNIDGVLPDDQRRAGGFTWPPPKENYVWEALQGAFLAAILLERQGRSVWANNDQALLRAVKWLYTVCSFPASGDDTFIPWIVNRFYPGAGIAATSPTTPGKAFGFTDWLYG